MENNDKQIIDQALSFVNENNRFAMKTITKNSVSRSNFYKLSVGIPSDIEDDIKDSETPVEPVEPVSSVDDDDPFGYKTIKHEKEPEDEPKDKPEDKPKDKPRKERKKTWYEILKEKTEKWQANAIMDLYGIDVRGMKPEEIADILETRYSPGPSLPKSNILNTNLGKDR
jgi:hypothetical protein